MTASRRHRSPRTTRQHRGGLPSSGVRAGQSGDRPDLKVTVFSDAGPLDSLLTTNEAAEILGVTPSRVFQLVRRGTLAPPIHRHGIRLWRRLDLTATLATRAGCTTSAAFGLLTPAERPLAIVCDQVVEYSPHRSLRSQAVMHLRIWDSTPGAPENAAGPYPADPHPAGLPGGGLHTDVVHAGGPDARGLDAGGLDAGGAGAGRDRRVVVLLGHLHDVPLVPDQAVAEVLDRWLPVGAEPHSVLWCITGHGGRGYVPGGDPVVESLLLTWDSRPGDTVGRVPVPSARPDLHTGPLSFAELAAVLGTSVDCFPAELYTPDTVGEHARTGRPVQVAVDSAGVAETTAALARLDAHTRLPLQPDPQRRRDATQAGIELAEDLHGRLALSGATGRDPSAVGAAPTGARWAAHAVPSALTAEQAALLERYQITVLPTTAEGEPERLAFLDRLWAWAARVGPHGDDPDPGLHAALSTAAALVATAVWMRRSERDGRFATRPRPPHEVRVLEVTGTVADYLHQLDVVDVAADPDLRRRARALDADLPIDPDRPPRHGLDHDGTLVAYPAHPVRTAHVTRTGGSGELPDLATVEWPLRFTHRDYRGVVAVADAAVDSEDGPVFLRWPDRTLTPLPSRHHGSLRPAWRFGVAPPAARALAVDLADLLACAATPAASSGDGRPTADTGSSRVESIEAALSDPVHQRGLELPLANYLD